MRKKEPFLTELAKNIENNFSNPSGDPEAQLELTITTVQNTMEKYFPLESVSQKQSESLEKPWISKELKKEMDDRDDMFTNYSKNPTPEKWSEYKKVRNKVDRKIKKAEKKFHQDQFPEDKKDYKKTWRVLNNVMKRKSNAKHVQPDNLNDENETHPTPQTKGMIANKFNKHFATVGTKISNKLPPSNKTFLSYLGRRKDKSFRLYKIRT